MKLVIVLTKSARASILSMKALKFNKNSTANEGITIFSFEKYI